MEQFLGSFLACGRVVDGFCEILFLGLLLLVLTKMEVELLREGLVFQGTMPSTSCLVSVFRVQSAGFESTSTYPSLLTQSASLRIPSQVRYDWTLKTYMRVSNTSPYLRFGTTGSLGLESPRFNESSFCLSLVSFPARVPPRPCFRPWPIRFFEVLHQLIGVKEIKASESWCDEVSSFFNMTPRFFGRPTLLPSLEESPTEVRRSLGVLSFLISGMSPNLSGDLEILPRKWIQDVFCLGLGRSRPSQDYSFAAILANGSLVSWGNEQNLC